MLRRVRPAESLDASRSALTKFRVPRVRTDAIDRARLLGRLAQSVQSNPVTLVCAPGGSGKTTALSQLAVALGESGAVLWIAADAEDDDANRFFAALVQAVAPLKLVWDVDPQALLAQVAGTSSQSRAALAAFVNALCTSPAGRIVLVIDDLHRISTPEVFAMLESLVERLPEHVALVLGSRVEPPLPLARWRAHGELGEFRPPDLQFDEIDAATLAVARLGTELPQESIRAALKRTGGWAVGVSMLLQSAHTVAAAAPGARTAPRGGGLRNLFAYLAQEILAELPLELQEFVLRSAILAELDPALCEAVTRRSDCAEILDALYRRNLFLTAIDEVVPVLRFHDLFREFLEAELTRRYPDDLHALHEQAARAEEVPARAVHHYLKAERWQEAIALIAQVGETLLAEGANATLERWLGEIPESVRAGNPQVAYLYGVSAWLRWDYARAGRELGLAAEGLTDPADAPRRVRAHLRLIDVLSSGGDLAGASRQLDAVSTLPIDDTGRAILALQRAWRLAPESAPGAILAELDDYLRHVARDPATIVPMTAVHIHCLLVGEPGVAQRFERFVTLSDGIRRGAAAPWHLAQAATEAWAQLWRGNRAGTAAAIARADEVYQQFRGIRSLADRSMQIKSIYYAAIGAIDKAEAVAQPVLEGLKAPDMSTFAAVWRRTHFYAFARFYWIAGKPEAWHRLLPALVAPRGPEEWPYVDTAIGVTRGQEALWHRDWSTAIACFEPLVDVYARHRVPPVYCDPRIGLAYALLESGRTDRAVAAFRPVLDEALRWGTIGNLLLDSRAHVAALFEALPREFAADRGVRELRDRLNLWWTPAGIEPPIPSRDVGSRSPLEVLSEREMEVLAQVATGASNKHIARALDLSLHTVKRHLCNILDKLDCDSRGQAADLFRRHPAPAP